LAAKFLNEMLKQGGDEVREVAAKAVAQAKADGFLDKNGETIKDEYAERWPSPDEAEAADVKKAAADLKNGTSRQRAAAANFIISVGKQTSEGVAHEAALKAIERAKKDGDLDPNGKFVRDKRAAALQGAFTVYRADAPQLYVDVNRKECMQQGIELGDVFLTLQTYLGSRYVNDFNRFGRTWQVVVQAHAPFPNSPDDVKRLKVRNRNGQMVPLGAIADVREITGPLVLTRYNTYPAAGINGSTTEGLSSGEAMAMIERLSDRELPKDMTAEWTEIFYLEKLSGNTGMIVFGFSVVFVFLVLAAQYESWTLPLAVILVVPMCVLSSLVGVDLADHDINVFTQVGFVVLIGLACKNAILIVEFAKLEREKGKSAREAALEG